MSKPPIFTTDRAVYLFFEFTMATISIATEIIIINSSYVLISIHLLYNGQDGGCAPLRLPG